MRTPLLASLATMMLVAAPAFAESNLQIGGQLFLQYGWQTTPNGRLKAGSRGYHSFDLTRSYLTADSKLADGLTARLTSDLVRGTGGDTNMVIRFAYTQAELPFGQVRFGLIPTLWTAYENYFWGYRVQGEPFSTREKWFSLSDLGTSFSGKQGALSYDLGYFNGEGRLVESDERKQYQAKLTYRLGKNWEATAFYNGLPATHPGRRTLMGLFGYKDPTFTLAAQHAWTRDANFKPGLASSIFATSALGTPQVEGIARWMYVKPNLSNGVDEKNVWITGVAYKPVKGYTILLDDEMVTYADTRRGLENVLALHTSYTF
ncbi:MAG: porin [Bacteroidota bacterium]